MANNLAAFNSEAWSARLVEKLDQINVMKPLVNTHWEGDLRQNRTVNIRTPGNILMMDYSKGGTIAYQDLDPLKEQFTVNGSQYFAFEVDDIDKAESDVNAMDVYMKRSVIALNNAVEAKLLSAYVNAPGYNQVTAGSAFTPPASGIGTGAVLTAVLSTASTPDASIRTVASVTVVSGGSGYTTGNVVIRFHPNANGYGWGATATATVVSGAITAVTVTSGGYGYDVAPVVDAVDASPITLSSDSQSTQNGSTGVYEQFLQLSTLLSNNNVPEEGRWAIVPPFVRALLANDTAHFVRYGQMGDQVVKSLDFGGARPTNGLIGEILNFAVYSTPHAPTDASGNRYIVAGTQDAITYAAQITEIEALRLQTTFANAIRGLILHDVFVPMESSKSLATVKVSPSVSS